MTHPEQPEIPGDRAEADLLFERVYAELREIATSIRRAEGDGSVRSGSLVHEAWLRMAGSARWESERHFKAIAARAMRQALRDRVRRQRALKRGGDRERTTLSLVGEPPATVDDLDLDAALDELERLDPRQGRLAVLRVLGGLEHAEIGEELGVSERTARREWRLVRAWLVTRLGLPEPGPS